MIDYKLIAHNLTKKVATLQSELERGQNRKCGWMTIKYTNGAFSTKSGYKIHGITGAYCTKCSGKIEVK